MGFNAILLILLTAYLRLNLELLSSRSTSFGQTKSLVTPATSVPKDLAPILFPHSAIFSIVSNLLHIVE